MSSSKEWGPDLWAFIHKVALYPSPLTVNVLKGVVHVIPCTLCTYTYDDYLKYLPNDSGSDSDNYQLFRWTVDVHNVINVKLGKQVVSFDEALSLYSTTNASTL